MFQENSPNYLSLILWIPKFINYHDDKPRNSSYSSKTKKETIYPLKKVPQAIKSAIVAHEQKHPTPQTAGKLAHCGFAGDRVETDNKPETQEWFVTFDAQCPTHPYKAHTFWLVQQAQDSKPAVILADRATEFSLHGSFAEDAKPSDSHIAEVIIKVRKPEKASFRCTRIWKDVSGKYTVSRPANGKYITEIFNSSPGYSMWEYVDSPGECPVG